MTKKLSTAAIAALLVATGVVLYFGTRYDLFTCDGRAAYSIGHAINLGGCKPK